MTKFYALVALALAFTPDVQAQADQALEPLTLQACVDKAITYQFSIRQANNNVRAAQSDQKVAVGGFLPSLNAGAGNFFNTGLSIDPVTNEVNRNSLSTANASLAAQWTVFDGFQTWNNLRQAQAQVALAESQRDEARNLVALNTASQFLAVLLADEALRIAQEQERTSEEQRIRSAKLLAAGAIPLSQQLSVEAQWAADAQRTVAAQNQLTLAELQLKQLIGISAEANVILVRPDVETQGSQAALALGPQAVYQASVAKQPQIRAANHQLMASHYAVRRAQGARVPTLSVSGQLATSYSDRARKFDGYTTQVLPVGYWLDGANAIPVFTQVQAPNFVDFSLQDQIRENVRQFVGVNLSVPLFNGFRIENAVQRAKLAHANAELQLSQQEDAYRQTVERAHADAVAAWKQYDAALISEQASERAFQDAQVRFEAGAMSVYDYLNVKNNYLAAASNRVRAQYDSQFKTFVLEFYLKNPLEHE